jgi:IclR family transcriptional regulator, KDG regulon repressor
VTVPTALSRAPSSTSRTVANAVRVLDQFSYTDRVLGPSELARRLGLSKSVVHRLLATLATEGFLEPTEGGRYRLGIRLYELGSLVIHGIELREVAHPFLERLRNATNETVHLAVLGGTEVVYVDRMESQATLRMFSRIGTRMPAHATSSGKSILAYSPPETVEAVLAGKLQRKAPRTIVTRTGLLNALKQIRADGYAVSIEESEIGASSVGAPVFGHEGTVIASVSVAGPSPRLTPEVIPRVAKLVCAAAGDISRGMGYLARRFA